MCPYIYAFICECLPWLWIMNHTRYSCITYNLTHLTHTWCILICRKMILKFWFLYLQIPSHAYVRLWVWWILGLFLLWFVSFIIFFSVCPVYWGAFYLFHLYVVGGPMHKDWNHQNLVKEIAQCSSRRLGARERPWWACSLVGHPSQMTQW